jgi:hypothetical protein
MGLNGMSVSLAAKSRCPGIAIVETHPKVLCFALTKARHDYSAAKDTMDRALCEALQADLKPKNDHEWDAAISALAAASGVWSRWTNDLHSLPALKTERLISPCGRTHYYWPES